MKTSNKLTQLISSNFSTNKNTKSTNDYLVEILLNSSQEYTRFELIVEITKRKYEEISNKKFTNEELDKLIESDLKECEVLQKLSKTVKNSLDQSVCHSHNNSSFYYNENYKIYDLINKNNNFSMKLKEVKK